MSACGWPARTGRLGHPEPGASVSMLQPSVPLPAPRNQTLPVTTVGRRLAFLCTPRKSPARSLALFALQSRLFVFLYRPRIRGKSSRQPQPTTSLLCCANAGFHYSLDVDKIGEPNVKRWWFGDLSLILHLVSLARFPLCTPKLGCTEREVSQGPTV